MATQNWIYWIYMILVHVSTFCILLIVIFHGIKIYFDIFHPSRKSLSHLVDVNKKLPKLDKTYKFTTITVWINLFLWLLTGLFMTNSLYFNPDSTECDSFLQLIEVCYQFSKLFMYLIFDLGLYTAYGKSIYGYNIILLCIIAVFVIIYHITIIIILALDISKINLELHSECYISINDYPQWISLFIMIMDAILFLIFLILFLRPMQIMISTFEINDEQSAIEYNQIIRKLRPTKYLIIISGAAYITLMVYLWDIIIPDYFNCMTPISLGVYCISVGLMSLYYLDSVYFQRLCCLCILCCSCIISVRKKSIKRNKDQIPETSKGKVTGKLERRSSKTGTRTSKNHESLFETRVETVKREHSMPEQSEMTKTRLGINDLSGMGEHSEIGKMSTLTRNIS